MPGPWTPLWTGSTDHLWTGPRTTPTDPLYRLPPKLEWRKRKKKKRNKYFSCGLSNRSCRRNFKLYILQIQLPFPLLWPYCKWKMVKVSRKPPGSLREASEFVLFPLHHFVQPILMWIRELVPGFTICSAQLQIQTSLNDLTTKKLFRLSHECNVTIFLLFAIGISLRWIKLIGFFFSGRGGGKKGVNYICTV